LQYVNIWGDFFGEIVLLLNVPRTASVKALTYCDIFELSRNSLLEVLNVFPDYRHLLTEQAEKRMSRTN
jgi:voltage-gated potassium channel